MSKKYNIDELLTESFENFSPEAPDVWQGIQQGVQAAQASGAAGSAMVAAKGSAIVVKIIAVVAVAAAVVAGYVLYSPNDAGSTIAQKQEGKTVSSLETPVTESKPTEVVAAPPVVSSPEPIKQQVSTQKGTVKPVSKERSAPVTESSGRQVIEAKPEVVLPKQTNEVIVEQKTTITQPKPTVFEPNKQKPTAEAKSSPPPSNPNTEEVVVEEPTIPGSFSPDGDGLNDVFKIVIENEQFFLLTIYDKQGKMVFQSNSKENTWDGKDFRNGNPCLPGTYNWIFRYQYKGAENESSPKRGILKLF